MAILEVVIPSRGNSILENDIFIIAWQVLRMASSSTW